jgi:hypothetical protein
MAGEGLEEAAMAFDVEIGNATKAAPVDNGGSDRPTEVMFANVGELEVDEDSPARGGGDDTPLKGERKIKAEVDPEDEEVDPDADPETDEEVDPDAEKDPEDEDEPGPLDDVFEVTVDGNREEVSLREALDGYIRKTTFDRRMGELGNVKAEIRNEAAKVIADRKKYIGLIEDLEQTLQMVVPQEPNWVEEYKKDPEGAAVLQQKYNALKQQLTALGNKKKEASDEGAQQDDEDYKAYVRDEGKKIMQNNPLWKDEKVMKRDVDRMAQTAAAAGFTDEEIKSVVDSRMVTILLKAAKYDRLQENAPKPIRRGKAKPVSSGAGGNRAAPRGGDRAMADLRKTGSVNDAARVFTNILNPRKR